jgi:hypothetical protein
MILSDLRAETLLWCAFFNLKALLEVVETTFSIHPGSRRIQRAWDLISTGFKVINNLGVETGRQPSFYASLALLLQPAFLDQMEGMYNYLYINADLA